MHFCNKYQKQVKPTSIWHWIFSLLKTRAPFLEFTSVIDLSSFSSTPVVVPLFAAITLLSTSLPISANWVAARCLDWAYFLHGMGNDDAGKMERFIDFFIGDVNGNAFNGLLWDDVNLANFVFFFLIISGDDYCEELIEQGRLGLSKQQKWQISWCIIFTGYFLPQKFNDKPTLRKIPFQVTNKYLIKWEKR